MKDQSLLYFNIIVLIFDIAFLKLFTLPTAAIVCLLIGMAFNTFGFFLCAVKIYLNSMHDNKLDTH